MLKGEFIDCFAYMKKLFPRINTSEEMVDIWYDAFKDYTSGDFRAGTATYVKRVGDKTPSIPDIRGCISAACGGAMKKRERVDLSVPVFSKIEFVMDAFGPRAVTIAIKNLVGSEASWTDLVNKKDWIPGYNKLLDDLVTEARQLQRTTRDSDWWGFRSLKNDKRREAVGITEF